MPIIDFSQITDGGRITYLSGKNKGLAVREELSLDACDQANDIVEVNLPVGLDCNESFLGGVFSKSISYFASRSEFLQKYTFSGLSDKLNEKLNNVITATLSEGTALSGLKK